MSEKTPTNATESAEKATQGGDESNTETTDQTDTSQPIGKDVNLEDGQQNDQQLVGDTNDLEQTQHAKEPPKETIEPGPQETIEHGPAQGPDEPPAQIQDSGPSPNQEPGSKETQDPSPLQMYEPEEPPSRKQEPEPTGTQQPSPSQTQNPTEETPLEPNTGQQPIEQGIPQETQNPVDTPLEQNSGPQAAQEESPQETQEPGQPKSDQQESDQQPTETRHKHSDSPHSEDMDSQENNEIKKNDQNDSTPPTKLEATNVEASAAKSEGETPPAPDDTDDSENRFQNGEEETKVLDIGTPNQQAELTKTDETPMEENNASHLKRLEEQEIHDTHMPPCEPDPTTSHGFMNDQRDETPKESEKTLELHNEKRGESNEKREKNDRPVEPSVSTETTGQEGEDQTLQTEPDQEEGEENDHEVFPEPVKPWNQVVFIETLDEPAIEDLLKNCRKYKDELQMGENLNAAVEQYETLLKKAKATGCEKQTSTPPPSELKSVTNKKRKQAPSLYAVIADVSKKCPSYKRWREAVSEFIILTTLSQSEPQSSQKNRSNSQSGYQNKSKQPARSYNNNIEKLLDQDWGPDRAPAHSVLNDYRHLFTCESVLRSTFPEADIFGLVDSTIRGPEDVPPELRHKALFHFLLSFNRKKYGVEPSDAWRDFGRLVLAEKQLELAKKAQGPDLHQNIIVKRLDFYKMQNELREKTEEVEELSTRLSKFASQQLTEGNPNIADLSDTHRPTRLGEMYSQLFDDEWSEAFEAFKPKTEDDGDDVLPDTLYVLQNILTNIFEFCKDQFKKQKIYLEDSFAVTLGFEKPKRDDAASDRGSTVNSEDLPSPEKKEQTEPLGETTSTDRSNEEEHGEKRNIETDGGRESSEQLSTPPIVKEDPNKLKADNEQEQKYDQVMTTQEHRDENGQQIISMDKDPSTDNEINTTETNQEPSNQKPIQENLDDGSRSERKQERKAEPEDVKPENRVYRTSVDYPNIVRHAKNFSKAVASTTAKSKSKLFIDAELPALIADEIIRADVRVLTYVRKCVELCWYMCMQDPPMVIVSPKQGQLVDKTLFSFHGRRGKIVEVCVWPALLLHDNGPLVCKGYVLPEERNRHR